MSKILELFEYSSALGSWAGLLFEGKLAYLSRASKKDARDFAASQGFAIQEVPLPSALKKELDLYFSGRLREFKFPLHILGGTAFERKVWDCLLQIPYGETRSYAWVAREIRNPKAQRAVGRANGKNRIPIVIPCHRVISSDGALGGYSGGLPIKKALLQVEGIQIR